MLGRERRGDAVQELERACVLTRAARRRAGRCRGPCRSACPGPRAAPGPEPCCPALASWSVSTPSWRCLVMSGAAASQPPPSLSFTSGRSRSSEARASSMVAAISWLGARNWAAARSTRSESRQQRERRRSRRASAPRARASSAASPPRRRSTVRSSTSDMSARIVRSCASRSGSGRAFSRGLMQRSR